MEGETTYVPTEDQSVAATRDWYFDVVRRRRTVAKMLAMVVLWAALLGAVRWWFGDDDRGIVAGVAEGGLYGFGLLALLWTLSYALLESRARRLFRQHRVRQGAHSWHWSGDGFTFATPNGEVRYAWSEVHRLVAGKSAFLLFFNDRHYLALPRERLDSQQESSFVAAASRYFPGLG